MASCRYHDHHFEQLGFSVIVIDGRIYWRPPNGSTETKNRFGTGYTTPDDGLRNDYRSDRCAVRRHISTALPGKLAGRPDSARRSVACPHAHQT